MLGLPQQSAARVDEREERLYSGVTLHKNIQVVQTLNHLLKNKKNYVNDALPMKLDE